MKPQKRTSVCTKHMAMYFFRIERHLPKFKIGCCQMHASYCFFVFSSALRNRPKVSQKRPFSSVSKQKSHFWHLSNQLTTKVKTNKVASVWLQLKIRRFLSLFPRGHMQVEFISLCVANLVMGKSTQLQQYATINVMNSCSWRNVHNWSTSQPKATK